jgi:hypothetical protein
VLTQGEREDVTARAGLPLVVETSRALRLDAEARSLFRRPRRTEDFGADAQLETLATLMPRGAKRRGPRMLGEAQGYLLGRRSRRMPCWTFSSFHAKCWAEQPRISGVHPAGVRQGANWRLNRTLVGRAADAQTTTATIDHDGTIIEAHKRDARVAYEGTRGYQPLVALWAEEQLVVADEFRDGNVAGGEDPLRSARRAFDTLPSTVTTRSSGDSAAYYGPSVRWARVGRHQPTWAESPRSAQPAGGVAGAGKRERERVDLAGGFTRGCGKRCPAAALHRLAHALQRSCLGARSLPRGGEQSPHAHARRGDRVASGQAGTISGAPGAQG